MLDTTKLPQNVETLTETLLHADGHTPTQLRRAIESRAAMFSGASRQQLEVPDVLCGYVDKVALHAHRITDDDMQRLEDAGFSEDEIFEITLCAALGAGLARFERGIEALNGTRRVDAIEEAPGWAHP